MAKLKPCKTCGYEIAKTAKTCPSCGAKNVRHGCVIPTLLIIFAILAVKSGIEMGQEEVKHGDTYASRAAAEQVVKSYAKSPSQATIVANSVQVAVKDPKRHVVFGEMDAPNSFGTMLRSKWAVAIANNEIIYIQIGDEKIIGEQPDWFSE